MPPIRTAQAPSWRWLVAGALCLWTLSALGAAATESRAEDTAADRDGVQFFVRANLEFTLVHELGHMLIDELALPVLGTEEDAADRIAVVAMVLARQERASEDIIPWLFAVAGDWYTEWELGDGSRERGPIPYWEQHPLEIQRFHNIVCLVFGSDPDRLDGLVDTELLPFERAMSCEREYRLAQRAVQWMLDTHGQRGQPGRAGTIRVRYLAARPAQRALVDWLAAIEIPETIGERLVARLRLPRDIVVEFDDCPGNPDAVWRQDLGQVSICYQLLEHFRDLGRYRIAHNQRACAIAVVRRFVGRILACPEP